MHDSAPRREADQTADAQQMEHYVRALKTHRWFHSFERDLLVRLAGRRIRAELEQTQQRIDPDFVVWNEWAPESFRVHVVTPAKGAIA